MENKMFCFNVKKQPRMYRMYKVWSMWKSPDLARMQDLLVYVTKGLSDVTTRLRKEGKEVSAEVNHYVTINLFTTITNANFDDEIFYDRVKRVLEIKEELLNQLSNKEGLSEAALWTASTREEYDAKSTEVGVLATKDEDVRSLRELITYGLKRFSSIHEAC